jgi:hypothetical protein
MEETFPYRVDGFEFVLGTGHCPSLSCRLTYRIRYGSSR